MYKTVELTSSDELVIKIPKEFKNKFLEIFVLPIEKAKYETSPDQRDYIEEMSMANY
ncbi:MAG: hypothetical protein NT007_07605 [Candidatus Kapabacteria bacterium]|nr:hypothetical protein [Candidatus Kapabacteria bacterium]